MRLRLVALLIPYIYASAAQAQNEVLRGIVRDAATARPLQGAIVTLGDAPAQRTDRSDEDGGFVFRNVVPGTYPLGVRMLGYEAVQLTVVASDTLQTVIVELRRVQPLDTVRVRAARQAIYGVVGDSYSLEPIAGASVKVIGASGGTTTDSSGRFFIPLKAPGAYLVRATAAGHAGQIASVTVSPDSGAEIVLLLDRATDHRALSVAFKEFDERMLRRSPASVLLTRTDLLKYPGANLLDAIRLSGAFAIKTLQVGARVCVFVDGRPRPTMSLDVFDPYEIEAIEAYTLRSDVSGTLAAKWPRGQPCPPSGMLMGTGLGPPELLIYWVAIWMKH